MQNSPIRKEPPGYPIGAVDSALRLIQLLRDSGPLRVADAAEELGVAPSTAHRLFAMLVYRDFAIQDEGRWYHPGPAIGQPPLLREWVKQLRLLAKPYLEELVVEAGESANLMIRVGAHVRFLMTVEAGHTERISDRLGVVLPAIYTAGGRAMLAGLPDQALQSLITGAGGKVGVERARAELRRLRSELAGVRQSGYARNFDDTEMGVSAVGAAVRDACGNVVAAVALAARSTRAVRLQSDPVTSALLRCQRDIEAVLAEAGTAA